MDGYAPKSFRVRELTLNLSMKKWSQDIRGERLIKKQFTVVGEPRGKGRPRFTKKGHAYTDQNTKDYEKRVAHEYLKYCESYQFPEESALNVSVNAFYKIPKSVSKTKRAAMLNGELVPMKKPDIDNVIKIVLDGLQGIAFKDDKVIANVYGRKLYSTIPRVEVKIWEDLP